MKSLFNIFANTCHCCIHSRRSYLSLWQLGLPWLRRCRESSTTSAPPGSWWWPGPPWSGSSWSPPPSSCPSCRSGSWRSRNPETRFTESIGPFPRLSCFQACKKNSVSFAVLLCIRETDIDLHYSWVLQVWQVSWSHTWRHVTRRAVTHHWHPLLLRPARFS